MMMMMMMMMMMVIYIPTFPVSEASMLGFCEILVGNFLDIVLCQCADYTVRLVLP
jgi:hypothetical protein